MEQRPSFDTSLLDTIVSKVFDNIVEKKKGDCRYLRKVIRKQLKFIREAYKKTHLNRENVGVSEWLLDNFYILEREGRTILRQLQSINRIPVDEKSTLPVLYLLCKGLCDKTGGIPDLKVLEEYVEAIQRRRILTNRELEIFPLLLRACLLGSAYREIRSSGEEETRARRMGNAIASLREFTSIDFSEIVDRQSFLERVLSEDPSGVYPKMDERSRLQYRKVVSIIAEARNEGEVDVAQQFIGKARQGKTDRERHVGYYILEQDKRRVWRRRRGIVSLCLQAILPAVLSVILSVLVKVPYSAPLFYLPLWEIIRPIIEHFTMQGIEPWSLPRMELEGVVPKEAATLVVVSSLVPSPDAASHVAERLEGLYHTNGRGEVYFCLLADLKESPYPSMPEDIPAISAIRREVVRLNKKYGNRFILCVRPRVFSRTQRAYSGWERKRGAITQLVNLICNGEQPFAVFEGDISAVRRCRYIIALDADTELLMDTAAELVGAALHPLNVPIIDKKKGIVTEGYGIIAPRIGVDLKSASSTGFSRTMAGTGGITAYDTDSGNFYQDLFGEGIFAGKGLIDVKAFHALLGGVLPEERVLSHDILEGSFLRTAFMSDVEMLDGFPSKMESWLDRLHRWIRGDWQNIGWILLRKRNPLSGISRYKLFDNLRRSLLDAFALSLLFLSLFYQGNIALVFSLVSLLSVTSGYIFSAFCSLVAGGLSMLSRKYFSRVMSSTLISFAQAVFAFVMMAQKAIVGIDAAARALWRLFVSKRRMLEWVTAADAEHGKKGFYALLRRYGLSTLIGAVMICYGTSAVAFAAGVAFVLIIPASYLSSIPARPYRRMLTKNDKDKLFSYAAAMWQFFEDFCGEGDNYLPCDNVQEAPVHAVAHRTSPTNIGLMLLSILAARDFKFIDTETMYLKLKNTLSTIEKMEKWNGNLYNWYDTRTLKPLKPRYVSAVDSGNFACCLVALSEGVKDYLGGTEKGKELLEIIFRLVDDTDLTPLYNRRRRLFHIGYDIEKEELSNSYYDLLMSEARMTSYFAIASRQVPKKHWGALGRTLARYKGYTGPVSWTGTMFEFYMPHLLLPVYEGSLGYEALRFCSVCQRRRVSGENVPWGISESGFYAFDSQLNYQYKAHGVQKLGLKRGLDNDLVVSPYSTFLMLPFETSRSLKNLDRLAKYGMFGRYGFYEAIDFTKRRVGNAGFAVVRSYMSHHVGMSLISVCNTVFPMIMQNRFMRAGQMQSARELLKEKIPSGAVIFDDIMYREVPEKPGRVTKHKEKFNDINPARPNMHLLSNGEWTLAITDTGAGVSMYRGLDITRRSSDLLRRPQGIYAVVECEGKAFSITRAPEYSAQASYRAEFTRSYAAFYARSGSIEAGMMACIHPRIACEQRQILIKNHSQKKRNVKLMLYFEPCLTSFREDSAHPAFSKLFIESYYDRSTNALVFSRRARGKESPLYLAVGLLENAPFEYETSRENILTRPKGIASLLEAVDKPFGYEHGLPDPAAAIRVSFELSSKGQKSVTVFLCAASSKEEALSRLLLARAGGALTGNKAAVSPLKDGEIETRLASTVLPLLMYPLKDSREGLEAVRKSKANHTELWSMGISGDYPIVAISIMNSSEVCRVEPYMRLLRRLKICGIKMDLVVIYKEGGDYALPISAAIKDAAKRANAEYLLGAKGGIHRVDLARYGEEARDIIYAAASHIVPESMVRIGVSVTDYEPMEILPVNLPKEDVKKGLKVAGGVFSKNTFTVTERPKLPWCHVIANASFGTLVSDSALGFSWAFNSRENKLTPWYNDTASDNRGEMLLLKVNGKVYDLVYGSMAMFSPAGARYESEVEGVRVTVTITVPTPGNFKCCKVELQNTQGIDLDISLAYYTEPVLGVDRTHARHIVARWKEKTLQLTNAWNSQVKGTMFLKCLDLKPDDAVECCCDRGAFLSGRWNDHTIAPLPDPCGAVIVSRKLAASSQEGFTFALGFECGDELSCEVEIKGEKGEPFTAIDIKTPDEKLNFIINTWAPYQAMTSRILARTGFYQNGGAWGFRDQLQDCGALILQYPDRVKQHIARCAAHQFEEGDVLHWWHTLPKSCGGEKGVRTRYTDDLLWLPYIVCEYIKRLEDFEILDIEVPYLKAGELAPYEHERYFSPERSSLKGSIYDHCVRSIERSLKFGFHGLPLIGGGDWNDGFNTVGVKGNGESVWLGMFQCIVLESFAPICRIRGDVERAERYLEIAGKLKEALDKNSWDGKWYIRAFYDNGEPMGSRLSDECKIDSLPQSFATICGMPDKERCRIALQSAYEKLVDERYGLIRLFDPPFVVGSNNPGYIKSYPAGLRENGGQYTHAAVWLAMAFLRAGFIEQGWKLIDMLNPISKCLDRESADRYKLEPYALAGDIYTSRYCYGRGGWSIYTGSAGWYYRAVLEDLLGLEFLGDRLYINPRIPGHWEGFEVSVRRKGACVHVKVERGSERKLLQDGVEVDFVTLDGKDHNVHLVVDKQEKEYLH